MRQSYISVNTFLQQRGNISPTTPLRPVVEVYGDIWVVMTVNFLVDSQRSLAQWLRLGVLALGGRDNRDRSDTKAGLQHIAEEQMLNNHARLL